MILDRRLLTAVAIMMVLLPDPAAAKRDRSETYRQLDLFGQVFEKVRAQYVEEVTDAKLIENAINGMLTALDPHSSYLTPKSFKEMRVHTRGEFGGLGIEVTMEDGLVRVVAPIDDTPASRAGVQSGDLITHLDGDPIRGLTLDEAVERMRGKVRTPIELTIRRGTESFDVTIVRDVIRLRSVRSHLLEDVGYVRITHFNEKTDTGVSKEIKRIQDEAEEELIGYVLDLRANPGGLLEQAVSVSDQFLDRGEIVSTRSRNPEDAQRYNANPGDLAEGLPIVVMIDGGSASASEIVAGALQDQGRAIVIGTQSFGKGTVQTIMPIPGHGGAIRLTTAQYFTPSGRSIQKDGIHPDIVIPRAKLENLDMSERRREADLRGALANPNGVADPDDSADDPSAAPSKAPKSGGDGSTPTPGSKPDSSNGDGKKPEEDGKAANLLGENDYQLNRAVDLLRGISLYSERRRGS